MAETTAGEYNSELDPNRPSKKAGHEYVEPEGSFSSEALADGGSASEIRKYLGRRRWNGVGEGKRTV